MSKARDLADFQGSASALTTGTLPVDRVPYVGRRNILINGDFKISQRGDYSSATASNGGYMVDRWYSVDGGVSSTVQTVSNVTLPNGVATTSIKRVATSSNDTGYLQLRQKVETQNLDAFVGRQLTLSGWMKTNNSDIARPSVFDGDSWKSADTIVADEQWHFFSFTFTLASNTLYEFGNQHSPAVASGDYYEMALWQLELGSVATPFEHRSYGEELALCQRYYQHFVQMKANELHWTGTGGYYGGPVFPLVTTMRANPSITKVANGTYSTAIGSTTQSSHQSMTVSATQDYASFHNNVTGNTIYGCQIAVRLDAEL